MVHYQIATILLVLGWLSGLQNCGNNFASRFLTGTYRPATYAVILPYSKIVSSGTRLFFGK